MLTMPNPGSGSVITIDLGRVFVANSVIGIQIFYSTSPQSIALTWLTPIQTAGGVYPYLFSQSEDISGRSMIPMQDTPSVKSTYGACVTHNLTNSAVVMSANMTTNINIGPSMLTCF